MLPLVSHIDKDSLLAALPGDDVLNRSADIQFRDPVRSHHERGGFAALRWIAGSVIVPRNAEALEGQFAGEVVGPESIWAAIRKLGCERIGHGVRAREDPQLVSFLKESQIPLEICVVSNVKTKVFETVEAHPIKQFFDDGLMVTVNSDDPTMFDTSITQEYLLLAQKLGFTLEDLRNLTMNGIEASFMSNREKESTKSQFDREWLRLLEKF